MVWLVPISGRVDPGHLSHFTWGSSPAHTLFCLFSFCQHKFASSLWDCIKHVNLIERMFQNRTTGFMGTPCSEENVFIRNTVLNVWFPSCIHLLHNISQVDAKLHEALARHPHMTPCINFCGLLHIRNGNWADAINYTCAPCSDPLHTICACLILQRW